MSESLVSRYILDAGWTMMLLVPAAIVAAATALRATWILSTKNVRRIASGLPQDSTNLTRAEASAISSEVALDLFRYLQPLSALFVLSSLIGLLGSFTSVLYQPFPLLPVQLRQVLLPQVYGLSISIFCYTAFVLLRARLFALERDVILPDLLAGSEGGGLQ